MMKRGPRSSRRVNGGETSGEKRGNGNAVYTDNKLESQKVEGLSEAHRLSAVLVIHKVVNCQLSKKR